MAYYDLSRIYSIVIEPITSESLHFTSVLNSLGVIGVEMRINLASKSLHWMIDNHSAKVWVDEASNN